ncbi:MAG TPA: thioredoxin domain-containing protein [Acidimicrobiales bacterium]|jgi:hypothetical protein
MERVVLAVGIVVVVAIVAFVVERRRPDPPTQPRWATPSQLDRHDFTRPECAWLVAVFTSATCQSCAGVLAKAQVLASDDVVVQEVEVKSSPDLHRRYQVEAVPITVVADAEGVVRASFVGPATATDLWAAVAEARAPGTSPEPELGQSNENLGP